MFLLQKILSAIHEGTFSKRLYKYFFRRKKLYILYAPFALFHKINPKKVVFVNFGGKGFFDNPKYIAKKLHEFDSSWDFVWLVDFSHDCDLSEFPDYIKIVDMYSFSALHEYATAMFWIENTRKNYFPLKKRCQYYIQTWHGGLGPKHSEAQVVRLLEKSYVSNAKKDSALIDLCVSNTTLLTNLFRNYFWYSGEILKCGCPRNDIFFTGEEFAWVKEKIGCEKERICLYAPTFRNDYSLLHYGLDYTLLKSALEKRFGGEWGICIRLHPNFNTVVMTDLPECVCNVTSYPDVQELLCVSDCVITDYSSLIYDFMLTKRPAFIFATDLERYIQYERGLNFTLDSTPFGMAQTNEELYRNITMFDNEVYVKGVEKFMATYEMNDDGHASERVVGWIIQKMGTIR